MILDSKDKIESLQQKITGFYTSNKSLGGFHLARQNLIELTGLDLMRNSHDQAVTGNQG